MINSVYEVISRKQRELREKVGFFTYLTVLFNPFDSPKGSIVVVYEPLAEILSSEQIIFASSNELKVTKRDYDLLSWHLLFANVQ